jgi:hypothetical protein
VEQVHQAFVRTGNRFVLLDAGELALERPLVLEAAPMHDLHRATNPKRIARQPHFAITAAADAPQQFVVGDHACNPGFGCSRGFGRQSRLIG